jgi:two-component system, LuxR family, response regulator DctR
LKARRLSRSTIKRATLQARAASLTAREREVFELVAAGEPNKAIARRLGISFRTVELHRAHIIEKLQAQKLVGLDPHGDNIEFRSDYLKYTPLWKSARE